MLVLRLLVDRDSDPLIDYGHESDGYTRQYDESPLVRQLRHFFIFFIEGPLPTCSSAAARRRRVSTHAYQTLICSLRSDVASDARLQVTEAASLSTAIRYTGKSPRSKKKVERTFRELTGSEAGDDTRSERALTQLTLSGTPPGDLPSPQSSPRSVKRSPKKSRKPRKAEAGGGLAKLEN